ncbi:MAG TPA: hypothetical protein VFZ73_00105 [Gemmatimonadaceae bacterium]
MTILFVTVCVLLINIPFGYWRAGVRRFSPAWFLAVHAAVPLVVALRYTVGLRFRWATLPLFVVAYFAGQMVGARLKRSRDRAIG